MTLLFAVLAALAAGYGLGRYQPWRRLGDWVNWQLRFHLNRWNSSRPRQAALFALLLATDPVNTVWAWWHRKDPPPPKSPPVRLRDTQAPEEPTR
ncbi:MULTISPECIES: hypothetical protein [Streptomyces]|uniref:Uncharacterized protein n=1 Tax=Streptomyces flavovirens TaxID=52258 RepID=A0ABV8NEB2_9ACTN|nr:hypothetical protein [Streptomyces sp. MBT51]MBK3596279.1 hypothetical protein [Streptomyces sp. MBT51]